MYARISNAAIISSSGSQLTHCVDYVLRKLLEVSSLLQGRFRSVLPLLLLLNFGAAMLSTGFSRPHLLQPKLQKACACLATCHPHILNCGIVILIHFGNNGAHCYFAQWCTRSENPAL